MSALSSAAWLFGILFLLVGFLFLVSSLSNREVNVEAKSMIGIFAMLIGVLLCFVGSKLKGRNGGTTASRGEPDDGWPGNPWYRTDPTYDDMMAHR